MTKKGWTVRIKSEKGELTMLMPDIDAPGKGFFDPRILAGCTVYLANAVNPLTAGCVAHFPQPAPKVAK